MADSAIWVKVFPTVDPVGPGAVGNWAKVTGGTVTTVTNGDGSVDEVHTFTADGTLTVDTPGYAEVLLVSGGSGCSTGAVADHGGGGDIVSGIQALSAGALTVVVGAGGAVSADVHGNTGAPSSIGSIATGRGRIAAWADKTATNATPAKGAPFSSSISGTARNYGASGGWAAANGATVAGDGGQFNTGAGTAGIVIVRVRTSVPSVSTVIATGGTISEYTGDGVNGVLGRKYKVHTFTANDATGLTVTQAGEAEVLVMSGGAGGSGGGPATPASAGAGGNGQFIRLDLPVGTYPVEIGAGGAAGPYGADTGKQGGPSKLKRLFATVGPWGPAWNCVASGANFGDNDRYLGSRNVGGASAGAGGSATATATPGPGIKVGAAEYGKGNLGSQNNGFPAAGIGQGGAGLNETSGGQAGGPGVVVVRYEIA